MGGVQWRGLVLQRLGNARLHVSEIADRDRMCGESDEPIRAGRAQLFALRSQQERCAAQQLEARFWKVNPRESEIDQFNRREQSVRVQPHGPVDANKPVDDQ
jgi:hypothetical protein